MPEAIALLERYAWPGNVRELRNVVERMAILTPGDRITADAIPMEVRSAQAPRAATGLQDVRDSAERDRIRQALDQTDWNVTAAARLLEHRAHGAAQANPHTRPQAELALPQ